VRANRHSIWILACAAILAGACAGEEAPPPQQPPAQPPAAPDSAALAAAEDTAAPTEAAAAAEQQEQAGDETGLVREVFSYRSSGRDPFISLLRSGDVRPMLEDLRITSINYNPRYPSASVAVLRDTLVNRRYTVRVGDEVGRLRIAQIRPTEVLVIIEEFGVEQQRVLRMRRRQEEQP